MKRQNGTISLDSRAGEGTQVRLSFPAAATGRPAH
jgi:signal transduction histidine kinase